MAGYTRQSTFADGDTITAALFNNEYNQLLNAFSNTSGHKHDGTANEGPVIGLIGDAGETSPNNKVLIDTTNNYIEFYVEVSSAPVQQLYIADGAIVPVTDSDIDLGTTSLRFKDTYTDTITTTGNVAVGGNLTVTGTTTFNGGTITMGDAATDNVVFGADVDSNIIPDDDDSYDLGSSSQEWRNLYIDGTANIDSLVADTADINGGTIDGSTIATSDITIGSGKTLDVSSGTLTLADDQISGDKVEGGTIAATTITSLTATSVDINGGTIDGVTIGGTSAGAVTFTDLSDGTITITAFADEDDMSSDSATLVPTQQSVKAYVDSQVTAQDLDFQGDTGGALSIDLDSESLTIAGGTGLDTVGSGNTVTVNIDSTVTTLTGTQTLTNKTLTTPIISSISNTGTLTLPTSTDTLVGRATTDTLTNKTLTSATLTSPVINTGVSGTAFLDDDTFATATASTLASSESIKAYVDTTVAATNEVVEDSTPQLGGDLDLNSNDITGTGNINITGTIQSSGNITGTLATAAQPNITSVGTLTGLNVSGTPTFDGLTVDGTGDFNIGTENIGIDITSTDAGAYIALNDDNATGFYLGTAAGIFYLLDTGNSPKLKINNNGDISFYNTAGTSQALFWDASAESLGIGTTSPSSELHVVGKITADTHFTSSDTNATLSTSGSGGAVRLRPNGSGSSTGQFTVQSTGNVGIGTDSPAAVLEVKGSPVATGDTRYELILSEDNTASTGRGGGLAFARQGVIYGGIKTIQDTSSDSNASMYFQTVTGGSNTNKMTIDSSGRVGIGTDSPAGALHLRDTTPHLYIQSDDGQSSKLLFGDAADNSRGGFEYTSSDAMIFMTNNLSEKMRIDSSGNLLVAGSNTNPVGNNVVGHALLNDGRVQHSTTGNTVMKTNQTTDGDIVQFRKNGSPVGSIGTLGGHLTIGNSDTGIIFQDGEDNIQPLNLTTNAARDAAIDLGSSSNRFKDLYLSGGVHLGGTGSANKLDDYEEGTFTPNLQRTNGGDISAVYSTSPTGTYTKIGRLVHITIIAGITSVSSQGSGYAYLTGLPFAYDGNSYEQYLSMTTNTFGSTVITAFYPSGAAGYVGTGISSTNFPPLQLNWTAGTLRIAGVYKTT